MWTAAEPMTTTGSSRSSSPLPQIDADSLLIDSTSSCTNGAATAAYLDLLQSWRMQDSPKGTGTDSASSLSSETASVQATRHLLLRAKAALIRLNDSLRALPPADDARGDGVGGRRMSIDDLLCDTLGSVDRCLRDPRATVECVNECCQRVREALQLLECQQDDCSSGAPEDPQLDAASSATTTIEEPTMSEPTSGSIAMRSWTPANDGQSPPMITIGSQGQERQDEDLLSVSQASVCSSDNGSRLPSELIDRFDLCSRRLLQAAAAAAAAATAATRSAGAGFGKAAPTANKKKQPLLAPTYSSNAGAGAQIKKQRQQSPSNQQPERQLLIARPAVAMFGQLLRGRSFIPHSNHLATMSCSVHRRGGRHGQQVQASPTQQRVLGQVTCRPQHPQQNQGQKSATGFAPCRTRTLLQTSAAAVAAGRATSGSCTQLQQRRPGHQRPTAVRVMAVVLHDASGGGGGGGAQDPTQWGHTT